MKTKLKNYIFIVDKEIVETKDFYSKLPYLEAEGYAERLSDELGKKVVVYCLVG